MDIGGFLKRELQAAWDESIPPAGVVAFITEDGYGPFYLTDGNKWRAAGGDEYETRDGVVSAFDGTPNTPNDPLAAWVGIEFLSHGQLIARGHHPTLAAAEAANNKWADE